ncbi:hypothetical protein Tco_0871731 [Tanacetum coccineum]
MYKGYQPSNNSRENLSLNGMHLSYNAPPFIPNNIQPSSVQIPTHVNPYPQPNAVLTYGQPLSYFSYAQGGTPCRFRRPTLSSLMRYVSLMPPMKATTILGLHEEQRVSGFVHGMKTRSLMEFLSTDLPITYKGLTEKTYTWIEAKEVATNGVPNDHRDSFDMFNKGSSWDNNKGRKKIGGRFNSPHNLLLRRTAMQKMGIVVSTVHEAIKFHTHNEISTVFSMYEPNKIEERQKKLKETLLEVMKGILSCVDAKERIVINDKHPE